MFKKFKNQNIDKKFAKLGYKKIDDDEYIVQYEKVDGRFNYVQCIDILHKRSGNHVIQCYQKDTLDSDGYSRMCGMPLAESRLAFKKAKAKGWK